LLELRFLWNCFALLGDFRIFLPPGAIMDRRASALETRSPTAARKCLASSARLAGDLRG
jgi:hypothetical protein